MASEIDRINRIRSLDNNLLASVFQFLEDEEHGSLAQSCKQMAIISHLPSAWPPKRLVADYEFDDPKCNERIGKMMLTRLSITSGVTDPDVDVSLKTMLRSSHKTFASLSISGIDCKQALDGIEEWGNGIRRLKLARCDSICSALTAMWSRDASSVPMTVTILPSLTHLNLSCKPLIAERMIHTLSALQTANSLTSLKLSAHWDSSSEDESKARMKVLEVAGTLPLTELSLDNMYLYHDTRLDPSLKATLKRLKMETLRYSALGLLDNVVDWNEPDVVVNIASIGKSDNLKACTRLLKIKRLKLSVTMFLEKDELMCYASIPGLIELNCQDDCSSMVDDIAKLRCCDTTASSVTFASVKDYPHLRSCTFSGGGFSDIVLTWHREDKGVKS